MLAIRLGDHKDKVSPGEFRATLRLRRGPGRRSAASTPSGDIIHNPGGWPIPLPRAQATAMENKSSLNILEGQADNKQGSK